MKSFSSVNVEIFVKDQEQLISVYKIHTQTYFHSIVEPKIPIVMFLVGFVRLMVDLSFQ